ncbi:hypothetical protein [Paenarthrobacter nicotinovorans]|uniref:hypothetical protein n=1 Tax=Paenarthrobacter nicotinovorans TaxID=29320 RepID=UPI003D6668C0
MTPRPPLTPHQIEILGWIRDGHVEGNPPDYSRRISAGWLARRDLVAVKGRGPTWRASLTVQGLEAITKGAEKQEQQQSSFDPEETVAKGTVDDGVGQPPANLAPVSQKPKPKSEQLLESLLANGSVSVDSKQLQSIQSQVSFLNRRGLVPKDKELKVERFAYRTKSVTVRLLDRPRWQYIELQPIEIPSSLAKPSAAVTTLQNRNDKLNMTASCFRHALLVVQALSIACTERGYRLTGRPKNRYEWEDGPNYRDDPRYAGHIEVDIGKNEFVLALSQESNRVPHKPTSKDQRDGLTREFDYVKIDSLKIRIVGRERSFWRREWSQLELGQGVEFLPRLLQELELRAYRSDDEREKAQQEQARIRQEWDAAKARAREDYAKNEKLRLLYEQLGRRRLAAELTGFVAELRDRDTGIDEPLQGPTLDWIEWIEAYVVEIDPRNQPIALPGIPEPTPSDLEPYMNGWSASGPYKSHASTLHPADSSPLQQPRAWHPGPSGWW